jgi:hypothetical protein
MESNQSAASARARSKQRSKREGAARTSRVVRLTERVVEAAKPLQIDGEVRQVILWDATQKGFGLVVGKGAKSWVVQARVKGRSTRSVIGRWPTWRVAKARVEALRALSALADGRDVNAEKQAKRERGVTLDEAWELTKEALEVKGRSAVTVAGYERFLGYLKGWNSRPLAEITPTELRQKHAAIARDCASGRYAKGRERTPESGKYVANRALQAYKLTYNQAARENDLPARPWRSVNWFPEERRQTRIPSAGLAEWFRSCATSCCSARTQDYAAAARVR